MDVGRDAHVADLVEHLAVDGEQPHERRSGAAAEHDLQGALEREDVRVEARRRRHLRQEILDVVEGTDIPERVRQVQHLLAEQEALFVVEHAALGYG